mmetsp:Transcript_11483/g.14014  ORF Transcript_11483/g.14014 Transcript_11483/m.14014 type:complete len:104 (+) Transcript_11483:711-1022(+)
MELMHDTVLEIGRFHYDHEGAYPKALPKKNLSGNPKPFFFFCSKFSSNKVDKFFFLSSLAKQDVTKPGKAVGFTKPGLSIGLNVRAGFGMFFLMESNTQSRNL